MTEMTLEERALAIADFAKGLFDRDLYDLALRHLEFAVHEERCAKIADEIARKISAAT
jgi:hypothetical protein